MTREAIRLGHPNKPIASVPSVKKHQPEASRALIPHVARWQAVAGPVDLADDPGPQAGESETFVWISSLKERELLECLNPGKKRRMKRFDLDCPLRLQSKMPQATLRRYT